MPRPAPRVAPATSATLPASTATYSYLKKIVSRFRVFVFRVFRR
jgi:hypothetical protein